MSLSDEQWVFLRDLAKLIQWAHRQGLKLTAGEIYRTEYQQREYVRRGLSHTMNSRHRQRLAVDLNLFINGQYRTDAGAYRPLGEYWESLSPGRNVWGGRWQGLADGNHFERKP